MKTTILTLAAVGMSVSLMAEETNPASQTNSIEASKVSAQEPPTEKIQRVKPSEEQVREFKSRQFAMMQKVLDEIGVTEEQCNQIEMLQKKHMRKMQKNFRRLHDARAQFSKLQDSMAPEEEIERAIDEIAMAQAEQLRILARNRRAMENILGKEKYELFMSRAHTIFREHDRKPGVGMPPKPGEVEQQDAPPLPPPPPVEEDVEPDSEGATETTNPEN